FFSSRRRHTRFSRDWSSDVCSSDLNQPIILSKRCIIPDFLIKGRKVIEVQGTYWHADPRFYDEKDLNDIQKSNLKNDQEKYKVYKENGYDVLYVWEYDIENHPEKVRKQIKEFLKK